MIATVKQFQVSEMGRAKIKGKKQRQFSARVKKIFQTNRITQQGNRLPHKTLSSASEIIQKQAE